MKFIHTADIHLKAAPHIDMDWNINRSDEIWETFSNLIKCAEAENVELLLIAGDLFHRQPLLRELKEVNYLFSTLSKAKVILIVGNHDYIKSDSYYNNFEWNSNVYCIKSQDCQSVYFDEFNTQIYGLSYYSKEILTPVYDELAPEKNDRINILLAHGGDDKHAPISKDKLRKSNFDYIALGHIHKPGILIEDFMAYAGSLEPLDHTETGKHGFILGNIDETTKKVNIEFREFAKRKYEILTINSEEYFTEGMLINVISDRISQNSSNLYRIYIEGIRDVDIEYNVEKIYSLGLITSVEDNSKPAYDFDKIKKLYKGTVVEKFIEIMESDEMTVLDEKALYYGVRALLDEVR